MFKSIKFNTRDGLSLAGDIWGDKEHQPVLFLHGGGQNRYSWKETAQVVGLKNYQAINVDLRGHGDSDYAPDGDYHIDSFANDIEDLISELSAPPIIVGASLGGIIALVLSGERKIPIKRIILVDVAPRAADEGVDRIVTFMRKYQDGFNSLEDAARAISSYLPHRGNMTDTSGLGKHLQKKDDGRYYWRWDPRLLDTLDLDDFEDGTRLFRAAQLIKVPLLLIRGVLSDIVTEEIVEEFMQAAPHAKCIDVKGAAHTVAGDSNSVFTDSVLSFLKDE